MNGDLIKRLEAAAKEAEDEAGAWDFQDGSGKSAAAPYLQTAALMREAAKAINRAYNDGLQSGIKHGWSDAETYYAAKGAA